VRGRGNVRGDLMALSWMNRFPCGSPMAPQNRVAQSRLGSPAPSVARS